MYGFSLWNRWQECGLRGGQGGPGWLAADLRSLLSPLGGHEGSLQFFLELNSEKVHGHNLLSIRLAGP